MNLTINSQLLAAELRLIAKVAPAKPSLPILAGGLLTAKHDTLSFYATDLEVGLSTVCHAVINAPGQILLPVARLLALVEQFPNADVLLEADDRTIVIRCGAFASRLSLLPLEDFPAQPLTLGKTTPLSGSALTSLITRTRYAISTTQGRYVLQGALLTMSGGVAAMVATDGKRLSLATTSRSIGEDERVVIPTKTLDILRDTLDGNDVEYTVGTKHLFFASNGRVLTSRRLEGEFPRYERILPRENTKVVVVDRQLLTAALRRTLAVTEENQAVYLAISANELELTASATFGSALEALPARYDGEELKVCLNGQFLLEFLDTATGQTVKLSLKDATSALLLEDGDAYLGVIMLMRS